MNQVEHIQKQYGKIMSQKMKSLKTLKLLVSLSMKKKELRIQPQLL